MNEHEAVYFNYTLRRADRFDAHGLTYEFCDGSGPISYLPKECNVCNQWFSEDEWLVWVPSEMGPDLYFHLRCVVPRLLKDVEELTDFVWEVRRRIPSSVMEDKPCLS